MFITGRKDPMGTEEPFEGTATLDRGRPIFLIATPRLHPSQSPTNRMSQDSFRTTSHEGRIIRVMHD